MNELVSIITPCYNGEKYLPEYLESVLGQTYNSIELIFIDDASEDNTLEIVHRYEPLFSKRGYNLIVKRQNENKGQAAAINLGLQYVRGKFLTWMDSDDIFYPEAIEEKVDYLNKNEDVDFVLSQGEIVNYSDLCKRIDLLKREQVEDDNLFKDLIDGDNVVYGPGTILVRMEYFKEVIPDLKIVESREGQNYQMMLPLSYKGKYGYLNKVLFKYVLHNDSHSHKQRNYSQEIERCDNFFALLEETINKITDMPADEKEYWIKYSYYKELTEKYYLAIRYRQKKDFSNFKKELKKNKIKLATDKPYFIYELFDIVSKMIKKEEGLMQ